MGLGSGILILVIVFGGMRLLKGSGTDAQRLTGGNEQFQDGMRMNTAAMAERLGMTEAELQAELDAGKTMQELLTEAGIEMPQRGNSSAVYRGSGSVTASGSLTASGTTPLTN